MARDSSGPRITARPKGNVEYVYGLDSIHSFKDSGFSYHLFSYGFESIPDPIHPRIIEDEVYVSGYGKLLASKRDDNPEIDAKDVEESELQDVSASDSNGKHEAYGL